MIRRKLTIKKKLGSSKANREKNHQKDSSLLSILQKQNKMTSKHNRNIKLVTQQKGVDPISFYQPTTTKRQRPNVSRREEK